ncbi:armadillo-type protein [Amylostereum chailletii]|nr:armadillo-type protein [Amylostereum chailletii]
MNAAANGFVPGRRISVLNADGTEIDLGLLKRILAHGPVFTPADDQKNNPTALPSEVGLKNSRTEIPPLSLSPLATARTIEDLSLVQYPEGIKRPKPELNVNAARGKFRYDRDFLLQFMPICKEKPDNLAPLDAIGLKPSDPTFSMSRVRSGHRSSTMATPTSRQASIGLGGSVGKSTVSPFACIDNFTTVKLSSEERSAMSSSARSALSNSVELGIPTGDHTSLMTHTPNQGGSSKDRQRTRSTRTTARDNPNRASVVDHSSQTPSNTGPPLEHVAPLEQSANRWVPISAKRNQPIEPDSPELVDRKVRALLNKITVKRFDSLSDQIIEWANKSEREKDGRTLIQVIRLIFGKATDDPVIFSEMYAHLSRKMMEQISAKVQDDGVLNQEGKPFSGGQLFRKCLLSRCQEDFERGWVAKEAAATTAAVKATEDRAVKDANETAGKKEATGEAELYSDEYYAAAKAKRRGLGLIRFIGELFKLQMLTERIIHECIKKLLSNNETPGEEIESLCTLLTTVGQMIDTPKTRAHMDVYFSRMKEFMKNKCVKTRLAFMLQDVVELRERKWIPRNQVAAPTTLAQVHAAAAKEIAAAQKKSFSRQSNMSFGGFRYGGDRNDGSIIDGWSVAGSGPPRPPPKAGDLSNFGKIGKATPVTFGSSGVFAGEKEAKGREASVLRTASNSTMFSMLSNADAAAEAAAPKPSRPPSRKPSVDVSQSGGVLETTQRRKRKLLPRRRPVNDSKASDMAEDAESEDGSVAAGPSMTEEEAKRKISEDVKEFFGVRSLDEAESYFSGLPPEHRFRLVDTLAMQGIDGKTADIPLIADLFTRVREKDLCSPAAFEEGFAQLAELVDDLAIDIPKAFDTFTQWIKAAGLDKDEGARTRLAGKVPESGDKLLGLLA